MSDARRLSVRGLGPLVLEYHAVSETWEDGLAVRPTQLRRQLEWLVRRGYRGATFSDAIASEKPYRVVAVTFDDAYLSVYQNAFPILASLGLPATVFAVTDFAEDGRLLEWRHSRDLKGGPLGVELRGMTWDALAELAAAGWEIGSHTRTHPRLTELSDEALDRELRGSREECERALGRPCRSLAYPFGDVDARVAASAAAAGYAAAATENLAPPAPLMWPRVGVYRPDSMRRFRLKVSRARRRIQTALATVSRGSA
jgi:peptidoglycan/xylan/chitin deacetylase (PgdA/CDA1 family)